MATKIIDCDCDHEYQDKKYGAKKRVGNWAPKAGGHRCSVCRKIKGSSAAPKSK